MASVVLMTDFGLRDPYVGTMKGVIHAIAPHAPVIDLLHEVAAQDIRQAALHLLVSYRYFATESVFCCVVDPGVGTERRAVAVRAGSWTFVCPDNGLLSGVLKQHKATAAVELNERKYQLDEVCSTFHGRDIFAPVAAHLAAGIPIEQAGTPIDPAGLVRATWFSPRQNEKGWRAEILHVDRFGNLLSNISAANLGGDPAQWRLRIGEVVIDGISRTFGDVESGMMLAYIGSSGFLEAAIRDGDAARAWGVRAGMSVHVEKIQ